MLATFLIEIALAAYTLLRYKTSHLTRLVATTLISLATFQAAEYFVCGGVGLNTEAWSRIGYVAIALLPPLGLHITYVIAKKPTGYLTGLAYGASALWIGMFAFSQNAFMGHVCGGNYVIFQLKSPLGGLFFIHYYIWLFITMYLASQFAKGASPLMRRALMTQVMGYGAFIIPTSIVNLGWPETFSGVPSIMCGFAVVFAIVLTAGVLPLEKERTAVIKQKIS